MYEQLEPKINAGEVELLDEPTMIDQLLGLVMRGTKIDHVSGEHDDRINAAAGALLLAVRSGPLNLITQAFIPTAADQRESRAAISAHLAEDLGHAGLDDHDDPYVSTTGDHSNEF
jgi:hypothetical protein